MTNPNRRSPAKKVAAAPGGPALELALVYDRVAEGTRASYAQGPPDVHLAAAMERWLAPPMGEVTTRG